jgi:hypothetical protein
MLSNSRPTRVGLKSGWGIVLLVWVVALALAPSAIAYPLPGTTPLPDNTFVVPTDATGSPAGTLEATLIDPWSFTTTAGTTSGTLITAVFKEASGTLDFYYQVINDATSATSIKRVSEVNFDSFNTDVAFRTDGSTLGVPGFVDGVCGSLIGCPSTADRSSGVIGFNYGPSADAKIKPGTASFVFVISTNGTSFRSGNAELQDGGNATVTTFQPSIGESRLPEPGTMALFGGGLLALAGIRRRRR